MYFIINNTETRDRFLNFFYTDKPKVALEPTQFQGIKSIPNTVEYLLSTQNCGTVVVRF
ncbi:MAG: hypothetical protein RMZ42_23115 [Nostoc sp. DedQUE05]|uniref:hypothetical protein n=1 Tax=Nostoc sp. DedQUE05 TaxID=3075391 RepID=UPI002AD4D1FC|nr:hypothetical protein [Nostoc sp. DedQUE05]MDZ8094803.1 hypothetical protein [Nostoc sp. DedQUE05]